MLRITGISQATAPILAKIMLKNRKFTLNKIQAHFKIVLWSEIYFSGIRAPVDFYLWALHKTLLNLMF